MSPDINEWVQLIIRWVHVFAAILWVGTTFFFTWLDGRFGELQRDSSETGSGKNVWMVHSGGFYLVEKQGRPQLMPQTLHWFRWEAAITWLSGLLLFGLVYYHGRLMIGYEDAPISHATAIWASVGLLLAGWVIYDLLWGKFLKNEMAGVVVSFLLIVGLSYALVWLFSGRAAYLQLGAMFGTIMVCNVWMRILPAQRRMVRALNEGKSPDLAEGLRAKTRSKHNTFLAVPVVFTMMSHHFPGTFGSQYNWLILSLLVLAGWGAAKLIRRA